MEKKYIIYMTENGFKPELFDSSIKHKDYNDAFGNGLTIYSAGFCIVEESFIYTDMEGSDTLGVKSKTYDALIIKEYLGKQK